MDKYLEAQIVKCDKKTRFVVAAVVIPGEEDANGGNLTAGEVQDLAHSFLAKFRNVEVMHTLRNVAVPVESWIERKSITYNIGGEAVIYPAGSWFMGANVSDEETINKIDSGEFTGFSIVAMNKGVAEMFMAREAQNHDEFMAVANKFVAKHQEDPEEFAKEAKVVTLEELKAHGEIEVPFVGIVDNPAVKKSKWVVIANADGFVPGSHEHIKFLLNNKIGSFLEEIAPKVVDEWGDVIFPAYEVISVSDADSVFRVWNADGSQMFRVTYRYNADDKDVELIDDPVEVDMETVFVPMSEQPKKEPAQLTTTQSDKSDLWEKIKNLVTGNKVGDEEAINMTKEELNEVLDSKLKPLNERLDKFEVTLNSLSEPATTEETTTTEVKEPETEETKEAETKATEETKETETASEEQKAETAEETTEETETKETEETTEQVALNTEEKIEAELEKLGTRKRNKNLFSKSIKDQEGQGEEAETYNRNDHRDPFGRPNKTSDENRV